MANSYPVLAEDIDAPRTAGPRCESYHESDVTRALDKFVDLHEVTHVHATSCRS